MPIYNCRECGGVMDPTEQVSCPSCHLKKPLSCSKCSDPINHHDIHGIEKLKTKRPLLCKRCGTDNEVVKCRVCKVGLVRSQGVTVSQVEGAPVYHKACLSKRREVVRYAKLASYITPVCILLIGFLLQGRVAQSLLASAVIAGVLFVVINMLRTVWEPR